MFSLNRPLRPIQSVVLSVPIASNCHLRPNGLSLRFLVKELIANIGIPLDFLGFWQLVTGDRWQLIVETWHMISDTWQVNVTCDTWHIFLFYFLFLSVSVRFGIGATISTRWDIQGLLYAGFKLNRPTGPFSHRVAMSVCGYVCDNSKQPLPEVVETSGRGAYR